MPTKGEKRKEGKGEEKNGGKENKTGRDNEDRVENGLKPYDEGVEVEK